MAKDGENAAGIFFSSKSRPEREMGRAGKRETRPLPLSPFPLPRDMVFGLYETESKRSFMRECIFQKFILKNVSFKSKALTHKYCQGKGIGRPDETCHDRLGLRLTLRVRKEWLCRKKVSTKKRPFYGAFHIYLRSCILLMMVNRITLPATAINTL